jgi:hypothetical protein
VLCCPYSCACVYGDRAVVILCGRNRGGLSRGVAGIVNASVCGRTKEWLDLPLLLFSCSVRELWRVEDVARDGDSESNRVFMEGIMHL